MVLNVHGHAMQSPGWADLQVYHRMWTGHIELKMDPNVVKDGGLQDKRLRDLNDRGTNACWISMSNYVRSRGRKKDHLAGGTLRLWRLEAGAWVPHVCPFVYRNPSDRNGVIILEFLRSMYE